ncbi:glycosyltransferase family 1 protein [Schumannella sp. 10F1B-5-1]|uniref:glycosyltransferase family 4 protein n=1 Tax=Schumannella sp. 10F1B-5-1 TaxID=2590780 RepID=UPI00112FDE73|nr:glycosyltransferase family 1 protein [Schumannella sp. 10F1B-5-1]TPW70947.1 glycosyltransferase family 4 protein [Schumannella sp. 10F1B-5-1]
MRIVVDCRYTRIGHHDGISRYTARVVGALAELHDVTMLVNDERQLEMLPDLPWQKVSGPTSVREPFIARQINRLKPDVVWSPMQTIGSAGRRYGLVLTLHDLIYYENRTPPRDLPQIIRLLWRVYHLSWWPQRWLLNRADEVVTVSATSERLIRKNRLTKRRLTVVTNAADELAPPVERAVAAVATADVPRELVYMGSYMPYKGVDVLVQALHHLPGYRLNLLSRISDAERARLTALAPSPESVAFANGASDAEYAAALDRATAFVHASRAEGFGIPLVESMSRGTPVVVSDIPIFREVGADAALYFAPGSAEQLAAAVRTLEDPAEWTSRSAASRERAAHYRWSDAAAALFAVLQRVHAARSARR